MARNPINTQGLAIAAQLLSQQTASFDQKRQFEILQALAKQQELFQLLRSNALARKEKKNKKKAQSRLNRAKPISVAASIIGGIFGGPAGAVAGGKLGAAFGGGAGDTSAAGVPNTGGFGVQSIIGDLTSGLFNQNQQQQTISNLQQLFNSQSPPGADIFDSPLNGGQFGTDIGGNASLPVFQNPFMGGIAPFA